jgi:hypothetical protein
MQEAELKEFLKSLNRFFPFKTKDENVIKSRLEDYKTTILSEMRKTDDKYDFDHLFNIIKKHYEYTNMPNIPFILKYLKCAKIQLVKPACEDDGKTLIIIKSRKKNDVIETDLEEYIICSNISGVTNKNSRLAKLRESWDSVSVRIFPKGWFKMGDKVYPPSEDETSVPFEPFKWLKQST